MWELWTETLVLIPLAELFGPLVYPNRAEHCCKTSEHSKRPHHSGQRKGETTKEPDCHPQVIYTRSLMALMLRVAQSKWPPWFGFRGQRSCSKWLWIRDSAQGQNWDEIRFSFIVLGQPSGQTHPCYSCYCGDSKCCKTVVTVCHPIRRNHSDAPKY